MVLVWAAFTLWRFFGVDNAWPLVVAIAYTPYITIAILVPLGLAVALRALGAVTVLVLCLCALVVALAPRAIADSGPRPDGPKIHVMTVNLHVGGADLSAVAEQAVTDGVDILSVQELTPAADKTLRAKLHGTLPHALTKPGDAAAGTGIFSRYPLTEARTLETDGRFEMPAATIHIEHAAPLQFLAIHPAAPVSPGLIPDWRHDLKAVPTSAKDGPARVLAGDFNATLDHATLRGLIGTGYTDAADACGNGLSGTWPMDKRLVPKVTLDHVLTSKAITPIATSVTTIPDTDHRALSATLAIPAS
jgi:endonuclease/exonuclease/phosphatase (EEP) superfamily protein YafD